MAGVLGCLGVLIGVGAYTAVQSVLSGWALAQLWSWFIVPFFNVPTLSIIHAIGLGLTVSFLTHSPTEAKDERTTEEKASAILVALLRPIVVVMIGYAVKGLM